MTRGPRIRLRISARFVVVLGLLVLATGVLGGVALVGLADLRDSNAGLRDAVTQSTINGDLRGDLTLLGAQLQTYVSTTDRSLRRALRSEVEPNIVNVENGLTSTRRAYRDEPIELRITLRMERAYRHLLAIWRGEAALAAGRGQAESQRVVGRVDELLDPIVEGGEEMQRRSARAANTAGAAAAGRYRSARDLIVQALGGLLLASVLLAVWLRRSVVPRARRYAQFASRVSSGDLNARLDARGSDELDDLGRSLDALADAQQTAERYSRTQTELNDALQVAGSEEDAHLVLTSHLERSIPSSCVVVLNRNNSADRLEARSPVDPDSPLAAGLVGAGPRDCLAVRLTRPYRRAGGDREALMCCGVCGQIPAAVACDPLLVSGEVIGSVLVTTPDLFVDADDTRLLDTVVQCAPVLANLRNLAIAELRAATDSLTGLPNARNVRDTVKRMAAHAGRTGEPLAVAMLDLDHFKQINDTLGHGRGDDVLAAVGAVLRDQLRASDFAGRMGGEEFVMLLPSTSRDGAVTAGQTICKAVAALRIPGVERQITISVGVGVIPEHAGDADGVLRAADRALYAAKEHGRNRVEVAVASEAALARTASANVGQISAEEPYSSERGRNGGWP